MPRLLVSTAAWGAMRILGNITRCAAKAQEVKLGRYAAKAEKLKLDSFLQISIINTLLLLVKNLLLLVKNLLLLSKETKNLLLLSRERTGFTTNQKAWVRGVGVCWFQRLRGGHEEAPHICGPGAWGIKLQSGGGTWV